MEVGNRHPLESITNGSGLSILEAMIPFVEYPLKLPLALFIKFNEIRLIINAFSSIDNLMRLGLHNTSNQPMDMLCSLTGISPEMLRMLMSLSESSNGAFPADMLSGLTGSGKMDLSGLASMFQQGPPQTGNKPDSSTPWPQEEQNLHFAEPPVLSESDDFDLNIQNILAEYDMMQAEQFEKEKKEDLS